MSPQDISGLIMLSVSWRFENIATISFYRLLPGPGHSPGHPDVWMSPISRLLAIWPHQDTLTALERQADKMSTNQSSRFDKVWKRRWAIQNYFMTLSIVKMKPLVGRICKIKDGGQIVRAGLLIIRNQTRVNTRVRMIFWQSATIIW